MSTRRTGLSYTNVFLIKKALIIIHANIFHTSKLVPGSFFLFFFWGGGGCLMDPQGFRSI